jgi:diguanylate cyclase
MASHSPYEQAFSHMRMVIQDLHRLRILPSPFTLMLWYCHVSGQHPDLSREIHALEAEGGAMTDSRLLALRRHITGFEAQMAEEIGQRLQETLNATAGHIDSAIQREATYGHQLETFSERLNDEPALNTLHDLMIELVDKTRHMQTQTEDLQRRLLHSSATVVRLRREIEIARHEATRDALTDVANRRAFDLEITRQAAQAALEGTRLSILLADIDHFKIFNDRHGHLLGDQLLKAVAQTIVGCVRTQDLVARYGGEEFAVILPGTRLIEALKAAVRIKKAVAANRLVIKGRNRDLGSVTLSIGVAEMRPGEAPGYTVGRADKALYRAKAAGRNRVMASDDDPVGETVLEGLRTASGGA